jgi:cell wall-associated NlpC family hydrolase
LKPGDILICQINKVPGHMMIVGGDGKIWHSNPKGTKIHTSEVILREKPTWHYRPFACGKIK